MVLIRAKPSIETISQGWLCLIHSTVGLSSLQFTLMSIPTFCNFPFTPSSTNNRRFACLRWVKTESLMRPLVPILARVAYQPKDLSTNINLQDDPYKACKDRLIFWRLRLREGAISHGSRELLANDADLSSVSGRNITLEQLQPNDLIHNCSETQAICTKIPEFPGC